MEFEALRGKPLPGYFKNYLKDFQLEETVEESSTRKMVVIRPGDHVWLTSHGDQKLPVAIGAQIKKSEGGKLLLIDDQENEHEVWIEIAKAGKQIKAMHPTSQSGVDDMIRLGDLNEAGILRNLHLRYKNNKIYTFTGAILVAVNPYQIIKGIYDPSEIKRYTNKKIGELPPHIFSIADNAYYNMQRNNRDQCVVISGESGAGKTESAKLLLQFLAEASGQQNMEQRIEKQILDSNPVLEAFGNAKTVRNDNSSRFGKFIELQFNRRGAIDSARIEQYLLEKSRLVRQSEQERNYHIFYYMLAGMSGEEKTRLGLTKPSDYQYLSQDNVNKALSNKCYGKGHGSCLFVQGHNDADEYHKLMDAMKTLGFKDVELRETFKLLAALLQIGNFEFEEAMIDNLDACHLIYNSGVKQVCALLEVIDDVLIKSITHRTLNMRGEAVTSPMNMNMARDVKDALVKGIYGRLFVWIVEKVNSTVNKTKDGVKRKRKDDPNRGHSIGLLDIFGFENFGKNSFEQLCINFANENLQQFFVRHVFKMEQEEYEREGIHWQSIEFTDNQDILDMIAARPMNILSLIDEESMFPRSTDRTMLIKLSRTHGKNRLFEAPRNQSVSSFSIRHFAGTVSYDTAGFLERNRDTFHGDLIQLIRSSKNKFLHFIFHKDLKNSSIHQKRAPTLCEQFRKSLDSLMRTLIKCQPFFVRCVKPNDIKQPGLFDRELVCQQLRYSGMMETIRIRRQGYPMRYEFAAFIDRYRVCIGAMPRSAINQNLKESASKICRLILKDDEWRVGLTKVFLKDEHDVEMEVGREKALLKYVLVLQRAIRGWYAKRTFQRLKRSVVKIQALWRAYRARKAYREMIQGYGRLQALWRARRLAFRYNFARKRIIGLQAYIRGHMMRNHIVAKRDAIVTIQAYTRGMIDRKNYRKLLFLRACEELPAKEKKKRLEEFETAEKATLQSLIEKRKRSQVKTSKKKDKEREREQYQDYHFEKAAAMMSESESEEEDAGRAAIVEEVEEDLAEYSFHKFSSTYFVSASTCNFSKRQIREPLLHIDDEHSRKVALCIWTTILRFMGELPESKYNKADIEEIEIVPVMTKIYETMGLSYARGRGVLDEKDKEKEDNKNKMIKIKLGKTATTDHDPRRFVDKPSTNLEKLHFIIGSGILRPHLRDEIYCQIMKQLTNNSSRPSHARGWLLMSLCLGCFAPTERLTKTLKNFLRNGPASYGPYCEDKLRRTLLNGTRQQPPSWMELTAAKSKKPIMITVTFMDGTTKSLLCDSATTTRELTKSLSDTINLTDTFGFSLFIALFDHVESIGSGNDHVMDAISRFEQIVKKDGAQERHAPWRIFFRKEIFSPWHKAEEDKVATNLIYHQICRGVKFGEYKFDSDEKMADLAAKQYYIEFGSDISGSKVMPVVPQWIPDRVLSKKSPSKWAALIVDRHKQGEHVRGRWEPKMVKDHIVNRARFHWSILFSRFYEVMPMGSDAESLLGPKTKGIVAINFAGIMVFTQSERLLLRIDFVELSGISVSRNLDDVAIAFIVTTIQGKDYQFGSQNCADVRELVTTFMEGLRTRSKYVVAMQKNPDKVASGEDGSKFLKFKKGDLIMLDEPAGNNLLTSSWASGTNSTTAESGDFPADCVWVLPTLTKPTSGTIDLFKMSKSELESLSSRAPQNQFNVTDNTDCIYTLEEFAMEFFNPMHQETGGGFFNFSKKEREIVWAKTQEPIRTSHLRSVPHDIIDAAVIMFTTVLKYCGDYPSKRPKQGNELTDAIFNIPLNSNGLRDELFVQLMRQLTNNPIPYSEERCWELMWLACGIFSPTEEVMPYLVKFFNSRKAVYPIADECSIRLQKTIRAGCRKYPPHLVEVEAIQNKTTQIFHKVYFPDDTDEAFEVESSTKARDFCQNIANRLRLKSSEGFSLFVKISEKVISVKEDNFFFDFVRQLTELLRKNKRTFESPQLTYQVFFMRKLWSMCIPGKDLNADCIFHFHQELPKYLRGYHKCTKLEAAQLAAFVYRVKFGEDKSQFPAIPKMLRELIPQDMIKRTGQDEWKRLIVAEFNKNAGKAKEDAKLAFLKVIQKWPTFGSAFFDVKQTFDQTLPMAIIIAINKLGVSLIDPGSKEILVTHNFAKISDWDCGDNYFTMSIGANHAGSKLMCETTLGYKMENLLSSYIDQIHNNLKKQRSRKL